MTELKWKECPEDVTESSKYSVDQTNPRIVTVKIDDACYCTPIGDTPLPLNTTVSWNINMIKVDSDRKAPPFIGIAPSDISQNATNNQDRCGWYFSCWNSTLWSGPPHNYRGKKYGPRKEEEGKYIHTGDTIGVIVDTSIGEVSFVINGVSYGVAFEHIPLDKPLVPCALIKSKDDSVELELSEARLNGVDCEIAAPYNIKTESKTWDSINITWDEAKGASFYQVEVGGSRVLSSTTGTKIRRNGLLSGTKYSIRVRTVSKTGVSEWSSPVEEITEKLPKEWGWKKCPHGVESCRKYSIDESNPRLVTKKGEGFNSVIVGNTPLPANQVTSWGIKIVEVSIAWAHTYVGVAPFDIDQDLNDVHKSCGWYIDCHTSTLYSGPPHNYDFMKYGPRKSDGDYVRKKDIVGVVMDTTKGELSFTLKKKNLGVAFEGIPLDKPLVPCVTLEMEDTIELILDTGKSKNGDKECIIS